MEFVERKSLIEYVNEIMSTTQPKRAIFQDYRFDAKEILRKGAFCTVHRATKNESEGSTLALKKYDIILTSDAWKATIRHLQNEVSVLRLLNFSPHSNVVRLHDVYADRSHDMFKYYLVLELLEGGSLWDRIVDRHLTPNLSELQVRNYARDILNGLKHCHDQNIVHRDLKLETLMLTTKDNDAVVKLIGFGFAAVANNDNALDDFVGSPNYIAPEVVMRLKYGKAVDMWSFGVILFVMLTGTFPFDGRQILRAKTKSWRFSFGSVRISHEVQDFIRGLLDTNPDRRLTAGQALQHPWMRKEEAQLKVIDLTAAVTAIRKMNVRKHFRKYVNGVIAARILARKLIWNWDYEPVEEESFFLCGRGTAAEKKVSKPALSYIVPSIGDYSYYSSDKIKKRDGNAAYTLFKAFHSLDHTDVLLLLYDASQMSLAQITAVRYEYDLVKRCLLHPNIVRYGQMIDDDDNIGIVLEYLCGGELFKRIEQRCSYWEKDARQLALIILSTIQFMHNQNIVHRNIRLENFHFTSDGDDAELKLIHFTDAMRLREGCTQPQGLCNGWPAGYLAPEIIQNQPYGKPVDMWAFGVVLYILLSGEIPFFHEDPVELSKLIVQSPPCFLQNCWRPVSSEAKDLVLHLLEKDPCQRWTAEQALAHPWFDVPSEELNLESLQLSTQFSLHRNSSLFSKLH